jgi:hypothetical protein
MTSAAAACRRARRRTVFHGAGSWTRRFGAGMPSWAAIPPHFFFRFFELIFSEHSIPSGAADVQISVESQSWSEERLRQLLSTQTAQLSLAEHNDM